MHKKIIGLLLGFVLTFAVSSEAQAGPANFPDFDFASCGKGLLTDGCSYFMNIDTAVGDHLAVDNGCGFQGVCGSIRAVDLNGCGWIDMTTNDGCLRGTLLTSTDECGAIWGHDICATFCVDQSSICGIECGTTLRLGVLAYDCSPILVPAVRSLASNLDLSCFNPRGLEWCKIKGDLAPVVPEPATLGLVAMGLCALGAARRKLVG